MSDTCDGVVDPRDRSQIIVAYLKGEMSDEEQAGFELRLTEDENLQAEVEEAKGVLDVLTASSDEQIVQLVNGLIKTAIHRNVSDIHIIPGRSQTFTILFRIDGMLRDAEADEFSPLLGGNSLPYSLYQPIIDRIKNMADINLNERRLPQDGRLPIRHQQKNYNIRIAILPSLYGERATLRIRSEQENLTSLEHLGYTNTQIAALRRLCRLRSGMILAGGWAGTGRTTLLYSLLQEIQSPNLPLRNILTVEDPVELSLNSPTTPITQTTVDARAGLNFAAALKVLLRSDPDVIYCSEIRDKETAELCVEAAMMGVLMLGSLPVTGALGIIQRLRYMSIPNYLIADSLGGLIGVRLIRRIDNRQTEEYQPDPDEIRRAGLENYRGPFVRGVPTPENGHTGFAGRIPLIEIVEMTPALRRHIAVMGPDLPKLAKAAFPQGGTLWDDARAKIKAGLTTVEEVNWALFDYEG